MVRERKAKYRQNEKIKSNASKNDRARHGVGARVNKGKASGIIKVKNGVSLNKPGHTLSVNSLTVTDMTDAPAHDATQSDTTDGGTVTLRSAIQYLNDGSANVDSIFVPAGTYYLTVTGVDESDAATGDLDINEPVVILGRGTDSTIIDGNASDRVFEINPKMIVDSISVSFSGLSIRNGATYGGSGEDGGGIEIHDALVTLDTVDVDYNSADHDGGGIDISTDGGVLWMNGGTLDSNAVTTTGGGGDDAGPGNGGGANFYDGTVTMNNVSIELNFAESTGGGIQNNESGGGAEITLNNCTVVGNLANSHYGGGLDNDNGELIINGGLIQANSATAGGGYGGGIDEDFGSVKVSNAVVEYNSSQYGGGIDSYNGTLSIYRSTIRNNSTVNSGEGAGIYAYDGQLNVMHSYVDSNAADSVGGGIFVDNGITQTDTLSGDWIMSNTAAGINGPIGGGVFNNGQNLTIDSCEFINDSTTGYGSAGGAFENYEGSFTIDHSRFAHNYSEDYGAAIDKEDTAAFDAISNSVIDSNTVADQYGYSAGIFAYGKDLSMTNVTVGWNVVQGTNGEEAGIWVETNEGLFTMKGGAIIYNSSAFNGGIYLASAPDSLIDVSIYGNSDLNDGAGVYNGASPVYFSNVHVDSNNSGGDGGGVYDVSGGLIWNGGSLSDNTANNEGGGFYFQSSNSANDSLYNVTVSGNDPDDIYTATGGTSQVVIEDISLPVEATSFLAITNANSVTISWKTQTETNNAGFIVMRQELGVSGWQLAGSYVNDKALQGLGTSSSGRSYSFTDNKVISGQTYNYKIQSVSTGGITKDLSTLTVTVDVPKNYALYQNYPNPFNPTTTIRFDLKQSSTVTLEIYNVLGQKVDERIYGIMDAGRYNEVVDMSRFASGVYYYRINAIGNDGEKFISVKKLLLMK